MNIKWDITYHCNLNCTHCINHDFLGKTENELDLSEVETIIKKLAVIHTEYVHLLGGEPTSRKDFLDIAKLFRENQLDFGFNTNGLLLKNTEIIDSLIENVHLKNIVFSLEGPTAQINDSIRGKSVFSITTRNISLFAERKIALNRPDLKLTMNTVLGKNNMEYINDMIELAISLGINELVILQLIVGDQDSNKQNALSPVDEQKIVELIANQYPKVKHRLNIIPRFVFPSAKLYAEQVLHKEFPSHSIACGAGVSFGYLNNKGELFPCDRFAKRVLSKNTSHQVNLLHNDFWDIFSNDAYALPFQMTEGNSIYQKYYPCNTCIFLRRECYPCPSDTFPKNKKVEIETCVHFYKLIAEGKNEHIYIDQAPKNN